MRPVGGGYGEVCGGQRRDPPRGSLERSGGCPAARARLPRKGFNQKLPRLVGADGRPSRVVSGQISAKSGGELDIGPVEELASEENSAQPSLGAVLIVAKRVGWRP